MKIFSGIVAGIVVMISLAVSPVWAGEAWQGIDEAVVNKLAKEHGREARKPLIDTGQGDLQLFMFLMAGVAGGFVAGYYWRVLLEGEQKRNED